MICAWRARISASASRFSSSFSFGLVDGFEDVADAVKEFGACIGEGVSFGFGGEDGADDFALVLDGKGDEVREVRKRVLQFQYRDFRIALVLVGVVFIIGSCINLIII